MNKTCIVYLASPIAFDEPTQPGLKRFDILKRSLRSIKKYLPGFPIIVFHEDYTDEHLKELQTILPDISLQQIDFSQGAEHFVHHKRAVGYMMMCRFFCGVLQAHPALQPYDFYMRMDDDSFLISPPISDPATLYLHDYAYRSVYHETHDQKMLYIFTKSFMERRNLKINYDFLKKIDFLKPDNSYSGLAIYNNFHISRLSMWNNPLVKEYLDTIENQHSILKRMWFDSNIHAMITYMLAPECGITVSCLSNFGYRHNRHYSLMWSDKVNYIHGANFMPDEEE